MQSEHSELCLDASSLVFYAHKLFKNFENSRNEKKKLDKSARICSLNVSTEF